MFANFEVCKAGLVSAGPKYRHPRSASGCLPCRRKKKKCDEKLPVCGLCLKHNESCEQNLTRSTRARSHSDMPLESPLSPLTGMTQNPQSVPTSPGHAEHVEAGDLGYEPFSPWIERLRSPVLDAFHLPCEQRALEFLVTNFEGLTTPSYIDTKLTILPHAIPIAVTSPAMKNALVACGFALLARSSSDVEDRIKARTYQCNALNSLAGNLLHGSLDENLSTILLLHIFEKISCDSLPSKRLHLLGATNLLVSRFTKTNSALAPLQIHRLLLEAYIYHIAVSSTFSGIAMAPFPPDHISHLLEMLGKMSGDLETSELWRTSSLIGVSHLIFDVIFRSSLLRRNYLILTQSDRQYAEELKRSLSERTWPVLNDCFPNEPLSQPPEAMIRTGDLYRLACLLLLEKILNPFLQSEHIIARDIVSQFCQILKTMPSEQIRHLIHLWPMLIMGSAAQTPTEKALFLTPFRRIPGTVSFGNRLQGYSFLIGCWAVDENHQGSLGMDVLLRDNILSSIFI